MREYNAYKKQTSENIDMTRTTDNIEDYYYVLETRNCSEWNLIFMKFLSKTRKQCQCVMWDSILYFFKQSGWLLGRMIGGHVVWDIAHLWLFHLNLSQQIIYTHFTLNLAPTPPTGSDNPGKYFWWAINLWPTGAGSVSSVIKTIFPTILMYRLSPANVHHH